MGDSLLDAGNGMWAESLWLVSPVSIFHMLVSFGPVEHSQLNGLPSTKIFSCLLQLSEEDKEVHHGAVRRHVG